MIQARFLLLTFFAVLLSGPALAQTGGDNPQNSLLPEINPQDIEIRSEFRARFPGLRRQPILGFNPKPRVFRIAPNRMPFMESREDAVANISVSELSRPEPPSRSLITIPARTNLFAKAGIGSYTTPELQLYGFSELNEQSILTGDLNFRSSEGHPDNDYSSFRYLDGNVRYVNKLQENLKVSVDAGGFSDFNDMFLLPGTVLSSAPEKNYLGAGVNVEVEKIENSLEGWKLRAGGNLFDADIDAGSSSFTGDLNEQTFHASFSKYWAGRRIYETFNITGDVQGGQYNTSSLASAEQWIDAKATLEYRRLFNFSTHVSGKAGVEYISDAFSDKFYVVPEVNLKHNLRDAVIITGHAYAKPVMQTLQEHHQYNRFLNTQSRLRHSYKVGGNGEVAFQPIKGNRIFGGISYAYIRDYAYYQRTSLAGSRNGFYTVNYGNANIFELYAGITQQLVPEKFWFDAKVYGRRPDLKNGGDIPYEERLGFEGSLSYKPINKLKINAWAEYTGQRDVPTSSADLDAFVLVNGGAEYQITETFGAYIKVLNILGQEYELWDGYLERPFQAFGGITLKF